MTSIHHATQKKADDNGFNITPVTDAEGIVVGFTARQKRKKYGRYAEGTANTAKFALSLALLNAALIAEYPNLSVYFDDEESTFEGLASDDNEKEQTFDIGSKTVPTVADVVSAAQDAGAPIVEAEDLEDLDVVVVARGYKDAYAKRGNRNHCGDWLAVQMDGMFTTGEGLFDHELFAKFLTLNGVDVVGKWADLPTSGQRGWQGRYRMNGRQKLSKALAASGTFTNLQGVTIDIPEDYREFLLAKHPNVVVAD